MKEITQNCVCVPYHLLKA